MFIIRPYREGDASACADCFYEGFFSCPVDQYDRILLHDYAQVLIEKCNFTYVAETDNHHVVGFICGKYDKRFSRTLANQYETRKHYGLWCRMFLKFYLKKYRMSAEFQKQFDWFFCQLKERDSKTFGKCNLELVALSSKKNFRKGLGTALVTQFLKRAEADGAECIRLFTNTLASWKFYEKSGFSKVSEKPFKDNSGNKSFVYEYFLRDSEKDVGKRSE